MFRLIIYMYDLKHGKAKPTLDEYPFVFLFIAERRLSFLSRCGLQHISPDLLQRGPAPDLSDRSTVDAPGSGPPHCSIVKSIITS